MKSIIGKLGDVNLIQYFRKNTCYFNGYLFRTPDYFHRDNIDRLIYLLAGVLFLISCILWVGMRKSHLLEYHGPESFSKIFEGNSAYAYV